MRAPVAVMLTAAAVVCAWGGAGAAAKTEVPFHRGVNLTSWLQAGSARQLQFTRFTKQDLVNIKSLGCDVIRLPINLHYMTGGAPDYTVDPLFFYPQGVFNWAAVDRFEIVSEYHDFVGMQFWFDDLRVTKPAGAR